MERYVVVDEIGGGGMGRVRLARSHDGRLVVLKSAIHEDDDERLRDEARVGLRLRHPGIVETIEVVEAMEHGRTRPVLVTAYVPGTSLLELRRYGPLPAVVVCRLGRELAEALAAVHAAADDAGHPLGIIHRDVTAANCLVGHDGHARLIDLGIARSRESRALRTEAGVLRGTLRYFAPELFDGGSYSIQTDLWSLGVALWEALLGRVAVVGNDGLAIQRVCAGQVMDCDAGERPDPVASDAIRALLRRHPDDRPRTATEAAAILGSAERALSGGDGDVVDRAMDAVLRRLVTPDFDAPTADRLRSEANRAFRPDEAWPVVTDAAPWPVATASPATDARASLRDYAARLGAMEQAHARAWDLQSTKQRDGVRPLPFDAPPASEGATVLLEMPRTFGGAVEDDDDATRRS